MLLFVAAGGCGTTRALVETKQGQQLDVRIVGGSPRSIYVTGDNHTKFTMRRDDLADVDHPGQLFIFGGLALSAFGTYRLFTGDTSCAALGQTGTCLGSVVPAVAGVLMLGWGIYSYYRSRKALVDTSRPEPDPVMKPRPPAAPPLQLPGWRKPDPFANP